MKLSLSETGRLHVTLKNCTGIIQRQIPEWNLILSVLSIPNIFAWEEEARAKGRPHHSLPVRKSLDWKQKRGELDTRQSIKWFGHFYCEKQHFSFFFEQNTPMDIQILKSYCWYSLLLNGWI
ncbi:hypothetical protein CEXT_744501 [Caerostris extrusa]|uniref:Uncharacterized protein n=1 Tax=Caerostris extrusa TaxID=172846 RepID=A0AAV4MKC9_CAEEX|nr:hypothetical protein CEXT_744501 [Caerostris extrusa]